MLRNLSIIFLLIVAFVLVDVVFTSPFTVHQTEKAALFRLGKMVSTDFEPGLHFKLPWPVHTVKKFDARILTLDSRPERFLTAEKKNLRVDYFVKWKVGDVQKFYTSVLGNIEEANLRLDQIFKDALRGEFSNRLIQEVVSMDRTTLRGILMEKTTREAGERGMELVDVRIKRIDLPEEVSSSVYRRMEAERARVAREFRSEGAKEAERIRAEADKKREIILADAYRDAEILRGKGDASATDIYAEAFSRNAEFYAFYRSLNAYKTMFQHQGDMIVLKPDSDFFKYFKQEK